MNDNTLSRDEHQSVFYEEIVPDSKILKKSSFEYPKAIILAGQPGAGKGSLARAAEIELNEDVVKIDPDELRGYHPLSRKLP